MAGRPTLHDVAAQAGVHVATASRALNPARRHEVGEKTVARVLAIATELGYRPNALARGLRTARSQTIGVLLPDIANPLFPPIVKGIEDVLLAAGYTALVAFTDDDPEREAAQLTHLRRWQVDGLVVATARRQHPALIRTREHGVPIVLVNRCVDGGGFAAVVGDDRAGVRAAVDHLVALGHTAIAYLAGPRDVSTGTVRQRAFTEAIRRSGLPHRPDLYRTCDAYTEAEGVRAARDLLRGGAGFTALLGGNDLIALGALTVLGEAGRSCPADVSVIGYNDMPFLDKLSPPLTSVRVPHHEMGRQAARLMLDAIAGVTPRPSVAKLPVTLVVRGSTGPARPG